MEKWDVCLFLPALETLVFGMHGEVCVYLAIRTSVFHVTIRERYYWLLVRE